MEENNTILQLNEALGELLDAYDKLKSENEALEVKLEEVIEMKDQEIAELTEQNDALEAKVDSLTSTTKHHSSELDTMLGRIKSTLGAAAEKKSETEIVESKNEPEEILEEENNSLLEETTNEQQDEEPQETKKEGSKEIDLGRMQSLLNGFNN